MVYLFYYSSSSKPELECTVHCTEKNKVLHRASKSSIVFTVRLRRIKAKEDDQLCCNNTVDNSNNINCVFLKAETHKIREPN